MRFPKRLEVFHSVLGEESCWPHPFSCTRGGYSRVTVDHTTMAYAHRVAYELLVGPIPPGLTIDHLCKVRCCVNPKHMEVVTQKVNNLRGDSPAALNYRTLVCKNGHVLEGDNLVANYLKRGVRRCRICLNAWNARDYAKRKAQATHLPAVG